MWQQDSHNQGLLTAGVYGIPDSSRIIFLFGLIFTDIATEQPGASLGLRSAVCHSIGLYVIEHAMHFVQSKEAPALAE